MAWLTIKLVPNRSSPHNRGVIAAARKNYDDKNTLKV
jgi:hypothetical protein